MEPLLERLDQLAQRLDSFLAPQETSLDWESHVAWRWIAHHLERKLVPVKHPHLIDLNQLIGIEEQKALVKDNLKQFVQKLPANHILLTGARGTGKSSLIKALLNHFAPEGLRLVEIDKAALISLPELTELLAERSERFLIYCDDLSFSDNDDQFRPLKAMLDGSIASIPDNVLIAATSNRRHLLPDYFSENLETWRKDDEIHPGERTEEKISLSERFGLWVTFYPFSQEEYLAITAHWIDYLSNKPVDPECFNKEALQFSIYRGSRSGRIAWQFAKNWVGKQQLS